MASFLVISTGGTIASRAGSNGLVPSLPGEELLSFVPGVERFGEITVLDLLSKDSSNMSPEDWKRSLHVSERRSTITMDFLSSTGRTPWRILPRPSLYASRLRKAHSTDGFHGTIGVPGSDAEDNIEGAFAFLSALFERKQRGVPFSQQADPRTTLPEDSAMNPLLFQVSLSPARCRENGAIVLEHTPVMHEKYPVNVHSELRPDFLVTLFPGFRSRYLSSCRRRQRS